MYSTCSAYIATRRLGAHPQNLATRQNSDVSVIGNNHPYRNKEKARSSAGFFCLRRLHLWHIHCFIWRDKVAYFLSDYDGDRRLGALGVICFLVSGEWRQPCGLCDGHFSEFRLKRFCRRSDYFQRCVSGLVLHQCERAPDQRLDLGADRQSGRWSVHGPSSLSIFARNTI